MMTSIQQHKLIIAILLAKQDATFLSEVEAYEQQEARIVRGFLSHKLSSKQYEEKLSELGNKPHRIICNTIEELAFVLDYLGVSEREQQHLFEHENAHYNEARANNLQARFCLTFYKTETGGLAIIPGTQINVNLNNQSNDEKKRNALRASISAPKYLSPTDLQALS